MNDARFAPAWSEEYYIYLMERAKGEYKMSLVN